MSCQGKCISVILVKDGAEEGSQKNIDVVGDSIYTNDNLSKLINWIEKLEKAPPGPPPRAGLQWRERTHRWVISDTGAPISEGPRSTAITDSAGIHSHTPPTVTPTTALDIHGKVEEYRPVFDSVMTSFGELFSNEGEVSGRMKTVEGIADKMHRKGYKSLDNMKDIIGTRIEFPDSEDVKEAVEEIKKRFDVIEEETHDRKDGYYSATHLIIKVDGKPVEVQVRSKGHGKIAMYAHDTLYKEVNNLRSDPGLIDTAVVYLSSWAAFVDGDPPQVHPDCPPPIRIVLGCLDPADMPPPSDGAEQMEQMVEKDLQDVIDKFKQKTFELIHRVTAPSGKYRLVEIDSFSDPFETGETINDHIFLEEAAKEKASLSEQNPNIKYVIYDEDSKVVG